MALGSRSFRVWGFRVQGNALSIPCGEPRGRTQPTLALEAPGFSLKDLI